MRTSVGDLDDLGDEVGGFCKINEDLGTEVLSELGLSSAGIDPKDAEAHQTAVLNAETAKTTTGTGDGEPLARFDTRLLDGLVDGDAGTEDWSDVGKVSTSGNGCGMYGLCDGVLLEGAIDGVSREKGRGTVGFEAVVAVFTGQTGTVEPLDSSVVAQIKVGYLIALCDYDTGTFVAADERQFCVERPVSFPGVEISVADAGELDIDEDLIGAGGRDGNILVDKGPAVFFKNLGEKRVLKDFSIGMATKIIGRRSDVDIRQLSGFWGLQPLLE